MKTWGPDCGAGPEGPDTCTITAVAALLKEAFGLVKEPLLDWSHWTLQPKPQPGDRPRAIMCRFHYHHDCVESFDRLKSKALPSQSSLTTQPRLLRLGLLSTRSGANFVALMVHSMV